MSGSDGGIPARYAVVLSDRYEADRDGHALNMIRVLGPDYADRWLKELKTAVESLAVFPGPLSWAIDEKASVMFGREVRRLLYYGPTRRRTGTPVRVLFAVLAPDPAAPEDESVILLLRLLHGQQSLVPDEQAPG